jgi:hypothetical protein
MGPAYANRETCRTPFLAFKRESDVGGEPSNAELRNRSPGHFAVNTKYINPARENAMRKSKLVAARS